MLKERYVRQPPNSYVIQMAGQLDCDWVASPAITQVLAGSTTDASITTLRAYVQNQGELVSLLSAMHHAGVLILSAHRDSARGAPDLRLPAVPMAEGDI
jgi:hypothetical protein